MPYALFLNCDRQMKAHSEAMAAQVKNSASVGEASVSVQTPVERQGLSRQQDRWCSLSLCGERRQGAAASAPCPMPRVMPAHAMPIPCPQPVTLPTYPYPLR